MPGQGFGVQGVGAKDSLVSMGYARVGNSISTGSWQLARTCLTAVQGSAGAARSQGVPLPTSAAQPLQLAGAGQRGSHRARGCRKRLQAPPSQPAKHAGRPWPAPVRRSVWMLTQAGTMYVLPPARMTMPCPPNRLSGYSGAPFRKSRHDSCACSMSRLRPAHAQQLPHRHLPSDSMLLPAVHWCQRFRAASSTLAAPGRQACWACTGQQAGRAPGQAQALGHPVLAAGARLGDLDLPARAQLDRHEDLRMGRRVNRARAVCS